MKIVARFGVALIVAVAVAAAAPLWAQEGKKAAPDVSGRWTMSVDGGAHGTATMGLSLRQKGKEVGGTFASPHGDMPVKGEFVDGALTLSTEGAEGQEITFHAKLKDDGTLSGYLSSSRGDMTWTARREK